MKFDTSADRRLRDASRAAVDRYHLPGLAVGVVVDDDLVFSEGFGYADIESNKPKLPELRQRIGSITKTMTALCVMALVDEGRLSRNERIIDVLPDMMFHGPARDLRINHLLTHTGGIGEVAVPEHMTRFGETLFSKTRGDARAPASYPEGITIEAPPGAKWSYANHGFALLGEILMRAEGVDTIDAVLRKRLFAPLGMTNTDCLDNQHPHLTTGYHRNPNEDMRGLLERAGMYKGEEPTVDGHNVRGAFEYEVAEDIRAAGAVQSTIPDMARYASALLRDSGGIVRPETFDSMLAPQWQPDARMTANGLAFFLDTRFGRRTFGHGGSVTGGWNTRMTIFRDERLAFLMHLNLTFEKALDVESFLLQAAFDLSPPSTTSQPVDGDVLSSAPGVYDAPTPGPLTNFRIRTGPGRIQILPRDGELVLHSRHGDWRHGVRMLPADPADPAFFLLDTDEVERPRIVLLRDDAGQVTGLRLVVTSTIDLIRNESIAPWVE